MKFNNHRIITNTLGTYHRVLESKSFIFFLNIDNPKEKDKLSVLMYNRKREFVADNGFALWSLTEAVRLSDYTWLSPKLETWLKERGFKKRTKTVGGVQKITYHLAN